MEFVSRKLWVGLSAGVLLLSACGGSSDDGAGQLSAYQVQPEDIALSSGSNDCPGTDPAVGPVKVGEFLVIGGTAPYTVSTAFDQMIFFGPHLATGPTNQGTYRVANRNTQFSVFVSGCLDPGHITIMDDLGRVANVSVTAASGSGS
jgi:hypothetical protein